MFHTNQKSTNKNVTNIGTPEIGLGVNWIFFSNAFIISKKLQINC